MNRLRIVRWKLKCCAIIERVYFWITKRPLKSKHYERMRYAIALEGSFIALAEIIRERYHENKEEIMQIFGVKK